MIGSIFNKSEDVKPDFHYAKIDEKVLVWNTAVDIKHKAHFAGISETGKPMVFPLGKTSWTVNERTPIIYDNCTRISK